MGPRSDNRGYERLWRVNPLRAQLQWVRGLITAVMLFKALKAAGFDKLQWVRGLITAVMGIRALITAEDLQLQWVRGLITAVMD